jgi:hypothetical protein
MAMEAAVNNTSLNLGGFAYKLDHKRIKAHLQRVEESLRSVTAAGLSQEQLINRQISLDRLREYWQAEEFPINNHYKSRTPIFKDEFGNYCAVGYLLSMAGYDDIVTEIQKDNNTVRVREIGEAKYLTAIASLGITQEEAAKIQPGYGGVCNYLSDCYNQPSTAHTWLPWLWISMAVFVLLQIVTYFFFKEMNLTKAQKIRGFFGVFLFSSLVMLCITLIVYALYSPTA